jgi:hypothetical protein
VFAPSSRNTEVPQTTITILSDEDMTRIETNRRHALERRAMRSEDARSRRVTELLATIESNRRQALERRRRLHFSRDEGRAAKRARDDVTGIIATVPGMNPPAGTPPPGWQPPICPDPPTDFLRGGISEADSAGSFRNDVARIHAHQTEW